MIACTRCHERKAAEAFAADSRKRNGRDSICKACRAALLRERRAAKALSLVPAPASTPVRPVEPAPVRVGGLGPRRQALESAIEAVPEALEPRNAAAINHVRNIADAMDRSDYLDSLPYDDGSRVVGVEVAKLNAHYMAAMREAGLTPGPRKPVKAEAEAPALRDVSSY